MADKTRDHLANERTFLAWVRTALGLIGLGFVLARMGLFLHQFSDRAHDAAPAPGDHAGREFVLAGVGFLVVGLVAAGWSGLAYGRTRRAIDLDRYEPAGASVAALTAVVLVGGLCLVGLVIWRLVRAGGP